MDPKKVGMANNVFVFQIITKLMELVELVILIQNIMEIHVNAIMDSMEIIPNVKDVTQVVDNARVQVPTNA